jgi:Na+-transporting methylmalonyl-CoA/oxaloacetate decarboxylase gamma subunit
MSFLLPLATESVSGQLGFLANLRYQTVGMMIVMACLCGLAVLVALVARGLSCFPKSAKAVHSRTNPDVPTTIMSGEGVPPEIRAVIAAAVLVTLKSPHRILQVEPAQNLQLHAWSVEGRRQIFQSHTFR